MSSEPEAPSWEDLGLLEAVLFASPRPMSARDLKELTAWPPRYIDACMETLKEEYAGRGINVRRVAGAWQMVTSPRAADMVERMMAQARSRQPLTRATMETLAIIAYKQPITRAQIEAVRGVKIDRAISQLFDRQLIREVGRSEALGKPSLLGTTRQFLAWFGLNTIEDLPPIEEFDVPDDFGELGGE